MRRAAALFLAACAASAPASAQSAPPLRLDPVADVEISLGFDGAALVVTGRADPRRLARRDAALAVAVLGQAGPVEIRRKDRRFGLWTIAERRLAAAAPSFYAMALSGAAAPAPLRPDRLIGSPRPLTAQAPGASAAFQEALIRLRAAEGRYQLTPGPLELGPDGRFTARFALPAGILPGRYRVVAILSEDGAPTARAARRFEARKIGLEAFIHRSAREAPLVYGLTVLALAAAAGLLADWGFRRLLRRRRG